METVFEFRFSIDPPTPQQNPDKTANRSPIFRDWLDRLFWDKRKNKPIKPIKIEITLALVNFSFSQITPITVDQMGDR